VKQKVKRYENVEIQFVQKTFEGTRIQMKPEEHPSENLESKTTKPQEQIQSQAAPLSQKARDSISNRLQTTWDRYIDAINRFVALNISVIVGVAAVVSFLPKLRGKGDAPIPLEHKGYLFWGLVLLVFSLMLEVALRIWAQQFMEYEVLQPREDMDKYFGDRIHYTISYRLKNYGWQFSLVRRVTIFAPLVFLAGLILSLVFLYRNFW
jgi:FtsH-binding integral membrane protein